MALTQLNQLAIAFKKLAGKAHTNSSFGIGNEAIPSLLQVGTGTIFGEPIPSTGLPSSLYGINGTVEKIEFQLTEISAAQYLASNPGGLSGATINASGDGAPAGTFLNGIHAYKLSLPSDYESNSSNPKRGTAPFTNGSVVSDSNGGLQIIPDSFAAGYAAVVYDGTSVIFPGDQDDYYLDYSTGILFIQDIVSGQPPVKVEAYLYIGKYLADSTLSYSGSFSGSFQGDGAGLTNVPASGVVGLNLTQIATSDVTASVQNSSNIFTVTSASQEVFNITDQGILSGSGANLFDIPASGITGLNLSRVATGSVTASVDVDTTSFTVESGSSTLMTVNPDGRIAVSKSINAGVPNLNPWGSGLEGSYFNNFDSTTDVSDILRFMAGLLSASAPDAAPNTKIWASSSVSFSTGSTTTKTSYMSGVLSGSTNARLSQEWNQSNAINSNLTSSYRNLQTYLISKGWMNSSETGSQALHDVGTHPFGVSSYGNNIFNPINNTFGTFTFSATSVNAGTTVFSSSVGTDAFGLGNIQNPPSTPKPFSVQITLTQSFSDTASITTPNETSTYSTGSVRSYTQSTVGTSNGLSLGIIQTGNSLIPNAFQDGKFLNTPASFATRKWGDGGTASNVTSSIGYYRLHGLSIGLSSSLASGFVTRSITSPNTTNGFYMPSLGTLGVTNITQNEPTVTITGVASIASFTATSRSLSGAPYISSSTYTVQYNTEVSKSFDPCYGNSTVPLSVTKTDGWDTVGSTTLSNTSVSVTTSGIQTSATTAGVFPAGTGPASIRSSNSIPAIGDVAFASSSYTFTLDTNISNSVQLKSTQETTNYNLSFTTTGYNWRNNSSTFNTSDIPFYEATRFGQPSASGSMAIYSRTQGYDSNSLIDTTETFTGETYRLQINDNLLSGSYQDGDKFTTGSYVINNLSSKDAQVKPNYLVTPGGTYGYWITDPDPAQTYKYYARAFRVDSFYSGLYVDLGVTLQNWTSTSNGVSAAIIFKSALGGGGLAGLFSNSDPTIFDISAVSSGKIATSQTPDNFQNPFSTNINIYGNNNGYNSGTVYGIPTLSSAGLNQVLNPSASPVYVDFVVLVRIKGSTTSISSITQRSTAS
jgi:hypothetical protein